MLDNQGLLNYIGINFHTKGKNTASDCISFQCPFCNDRSDHMNLSKFGSVRCWRCGSHKLGDLLNVLGFIGNIKDFFTGDTDYKINNIKYQKSSLLTAACSVPGQELSVGAASYLQARGFDPLVCKKQYGFKSIGGWLFSKACFHLQKRIIIPVYDLSGIPVSWVARDYSGSAKLRYITPKPEEASANIKDYLYNQQACSEQTGYIFVVEGIFDCIRMGANTVATLGTSLSAKQLGKLSKYKKIFWFFDNEISAAFTAYRYASQLRGCGVESVLLLGSAASGGGVGGGVGGGGVKNCDINHFLGDKKDPGELTPGAVAELKHYVLSNF